MLPRGGSSKLLAACDGPRTTLLLGGPQRTLALDLRLGIREHARHVVGSAAYLAGAAGVGMGPRLLLVLSDLSGIPDRALSLSSAPLGVNLLLLGRPPTLILHVLVFIVIFLVVVAALLDLHRLRGVDIVLVDERVHLAHERPHVHRRSVEAHLQVLVLGLDLADLGFQHFDLVLELSHIHGHLLLPQVLELPSQLRLSALELPEVALRLGDLPPHCRLLTL